MRILRDVELLVVGVVAAAVGFFWVFAPKIAWGAWPELLLFFILIGTASMLPIPDPRGGYVTATAVLFYVLLSTHGPGASILIGGAAYGVGAAVSRGWVPWKTLFNGAQIGISAGLGALAFEATGGSASDPGIFSFLVPFAVGAATHKAFNTFFVALYFHRTQKQPFLSAWISGIKDFLSSNVLSILSAALLTILYESIHPLTLLFYLGSLPLQRWAIQLYLQHRRIYSQAIDSLVRAIDADFPEGRGHSKRVADAASAIARQLNLPEPSVEVIELGALLHDVGMIGLKDSVKSLRAPEASERLRDHVRIGAELASELPRREVAEIVLYHHECFDGSGYPAGLRGTQIPIGARIVAVAEAFDSMLASVSLFDQRVQGTDAITAIKQGSARLFDPQVVDALLSAIAAGSIAYGRATNGTEAMEALPGTG